MDRNEGSGSVRLRTARQRETRHQRGSARSAWRDTVLVAVALCSNVQLAWAGGPGVFPTGEGQIGAVPGVGELLGGFTAETLTSQVPIAELTTRAGMPNIGVWQTNLHLPGEAELLLDVPVSLDSVLGMPPTSARSPGAMDDALVAYSFAADGAVPGTMSVQVLVLDRNGELVSSTVPAEDVPTFADPAINATGIAIDEQGRITSVFTDLSGGVARVKARRLDGVTGAAIGQEFEVTPVGYADTDIALLDPAGDRLLVAASTFATIVGFEIITTGPDPVVMPGFPISTTPSQFANLNPEIATDPSTGESFVVWENTDAVQGDPINIRGRRFDADGNPIGDDFLVNTTVANAQAQPDVAYGPDGLSVVAWAGDSGIQGDELDVFAQAYDADGNPIGPEMRVNTVTEGVQDKPVVRFLPEGDALGQPQFVVAWRDVAVSDGSSPNGTGKSYKCFSIGEDPARIFEDGFESGDTTSWSATVSGN